MYSLVNCKVVRNEINLLTIGSSSSGIVPKETFLDPSSTQVVTITSLLITSTTYNSFVSDSTVSVVSVFLMTNGLISATTCFPVFLLIIVVITTLSVVSVFLITSSTLITPVFSFLMNVYSTTTGWSWNFSTTTVLIISLIFGFIFSFLIGTKTGSSSYSSSIIVVSVVSVVVTTSLTTLEITVGSS